MYAYQDLTERDLMKLKAMQPYVRQISPPTPWDAVIVKTICGETDLKSLSDDMSIYVAIAVTAVKIFHCPLEKIKEVFEEGRIIDYAYGRYLEHKLSEITKQINENPEGVEKMMIEMSPAMVDILEPSDEDVHMFAIIFEDDHEKFALSSVDEQMCIMMAIKILKCDLEEIKKALQSGTIIKYTYDRYIQSKREEVANIQNKKYIMPTCRTLQ